MRYNKCFQADNKQLVVRSFFSFIELYKKRT